MTTLGPNDAVVVRRGESETLGHPALATIALLADGSDTAGALSVIQVSLAEGIDGANPHRHVNSAELFYVLDGQADVLAGDHVLQAARGDLVVVPHHMPHAFAASVGRPADLLIVLAPGIDRFDYFRLLEQVVGGSVPGDRLAAAQERFDTWFVESRVWDEARSGGKEPRRGAR
jgi:mannose-6-phosphate isomerase-like protein (cupin superfamily)